MFINKNKIPSEGHGISLLEPPPSIVKSFLILSLHPPFFFFLLPSEDKMSLVKY